MYECIFNTTNTLELNIHFYFWFIITFSAVHLWNFRMKKKQKTFVCLTQLAYPIPNKISALQCSKNQRNYV